MSPPMPELLPCPTCQQVRQSIACFLPADANIDDRPTLDALNQVFREVVRLRKVPSPVNTALRDAAGMAEVVALLQTISEVFPNGRYSHQAEVLQKARALLAKLTT